MTARATPSPDASAGRWTLVSAVLGSSMAFMDGTVVNVALPAIQRSMNASGADAQWLIEAYALFLAALLLVGGALGDRFGRKRVFLIGVVVFTAMSAACAAAQDTGQLIAARALQGIGAALLVPGSLALLGANFPEASRGRAIGTWSAFSGITAAIGPVVGGFLVDHFSWRWAFVLNVPIGGVLVLACLAKVPESRGDATDGPVDLAGAVTATLGLAGVVFALIEAPTRGWGSAPVAIAGVVGLAGLAAFIACEARVRNPMLPLHLFADRDFAGANLLTLLLYAALGGSLYFVPLNLIQVQGYAATAAGAALLPFVAIMFALSRWAGSLVDRMGAKIPLVVGPAIAAAGFALLARPGVGGSYWTTFFPAMAVLGLGMTITISPLTTTVMNALGEKLAGTASGVNNAVSRAAGLLAIAALGAVLAQVFEPRLHDALAHAQLPAGVADAVYAQRSKLGAIAAPAGAASAVAAQVRDAVGHAFVAGFRAVMLCSAGLALASALSAWWLISGRKPGIDSKGSSP
ncbi:MFS transporter [Scleromatobacter humisilvae]|uniref:MFS transporter n=1 Tax=Scleromatobacter humisilvae TaxID=2897159 RepID=A0A9X1YKL6_9BURK|nr:MFS transporter [Scleromatobacter humisilvae]MCK9687462.1 MFS transporter [Scleromatobacter humisilvae]